MDFSTREDIEAPIDFVFDAVTDFDRFERQALRRGAEVSRQDTGSVPGMGSNWKMKLKFRGKPRNVEAEVTRFERPNIIQIDSVTNGIEAYSTIELVALSPRRTRLSTKIDLQPSSLTGKLLVKSLKFARASMNKRLNARAAKFARDVEDRYAANVG